jgi:predicted DNA-binding ArsR family transcriptional regulator
VRGRKFLSAFEIKLITARPDISHVDELNRIKVVSEVAELVPILRAVDSDVKAEVFKEVSAGWKTVREIEEKYGTEGADALRFFEKMKLVETKWQTGPTASPEKAYHAFYSSFHINATAPIQEISDVLHAAMMSEEAYAVIEQRIFDMVGPEGKFSGDVADALKVTQTKLKALVKRSPRLDFRGHRIIRFED